MATEIIVTNEFRDWYEALSAMEQGSVERVVGLLADEGTRLDFPYSSKINGSRHSAMRELRIQHGGDPYRVLYIFDPSRNAVLLVGGTKTGKGNAWYRSAIRLADRLYDEYLRKGSS